MVLYYALFASDANSCLRNYSFNVLYAALKISIKDDNVEEMVWIHQIISNIHLRREVELLGLLWCLKN